MGSLALAHGKLTRKPVASHENDDRSPAGRRDGRVKQMGTLALAHGKLTRKPVRGAADEAEDDHGKGQVVLTEQEEQIRTLALRGLDEGEPVPAPIYNAVKPSLGTGERAEKKRAFMAQLFQANLELRESFNSDPR